MNINIKLPKMPNLRNLTRKAITTTAQGLEALDAKLEPKISNKHLLSELKRVLEDAELDDKSKLMALEFLQTRIDNLNNA